MSLLQASKFVPYLLPLTVVLLTVTGMIIAGISGKRREARRRVALASVASELGMTFTPDDDALLKQFGGHAFFPRGIAPHAMSVMRGTVEGVPATLFDYHTTVGVGKGMNTVKQTVAAFDVAAAPLPMFTMQRWSKNWLTTLLDSSTAERIDFPDDPEFTRAFFVFGSETEAVRRLFGADVRAFLRKRPKWMVRSDGRWLLMCEIGKRPAPDDYRNFLAEVTEGLRAITRAGE